MSGNRKQKVSDIDVNLKPMIGSLFKKEAVIMAVDCSQSMANKFDGSNRTNFDLTKQCLTNIVKQKLFAEIKNEYLLVEFPLSKGSGIKPIGHLRLPSLDLLKYVNDRLRPIDNSLLPTNVMDALCETIPLMISERTAQKFDTSTIVLFTDFHHLNESDLKCFQNQIGEQLMNAKIQLIVVSPFTSSSEEEKATHPQKHALNLIKFIEDNRLGKCLDFESVINHFDQFAVYKPSSAVSYSTLELGTGLNALNIPIGTSIKALAYKKKRGKVTRFRPDLDSSSQFRTDSDPIPGIVYPSNQFSQSSPLRTDLSQSTSATVKEAKNEYGFCYGDIVVPFSDQDKERFSYDKLKKGFKIIGFTSSKNLNFSQRMGEKTSIMFADPRLPKKNHESIFQALVTAMIETEKVAIVRYGLNDRSPPKMGFLMPLIEDNKLVMVYLQLPFAEDVREVSFPSLSTKLFTPTSEQLEAIDKLIDCMDLMKADTNDDGNPCEALISCQTADPSLQYWFELLYTKRFYDNGVDLPQMPQRLRRSIETPEEIAKKAELVFNEILDKFKLVELKTQKKSPPRKSDFSQLDVKRPKLEANLDIDAIKRQISDSLKSGSHFPQVADKIKDTLKLLFENYSEEQNEEIIGLVEQFRAKSVANGEPKHFNDFMLNYVNSFRGTDVWYALLSNEIKPIGETECPNSATNQQIIDEFISLSNDSFQDE